MGLRKYQQKRNFRVSAEPAGQTRQTKKARQAARFIIQKHDATRLHYDFRLEAEGVLKSWAVPKGLPWAQAEKHLAVEVEDHPVEYVDFEGIIPKGQYGGGTVMVWDRGTYEITQAESAAAGIRAGKFHVILHGEKVDSEWAMIRIRSDTEKNQWLLMKTGGATKSVSKKLDDRSVKTGRTMKQIASAADAEWQSNRGSAADTRAAARRKRKIKAPFSDAELKSLPKKSAQFVEPMKPKLCESAPSDDGWLFELKFDGIRALVIRKGGDIRLLSRNRRDLTQRFASIAAGIAKMEGDEFVVDGEIVALDEKGRSSFQ
ncbi:MAG: ATP-dependent DNA ligase, partial [Verrucomicrobiota bacterium]|nr:ATP-dependent DNA ligase [Verrucomicrobiota bacterium]